MLAVTGLDSYGERELITSLAYNFAKGIEYFVICYIRCRTVGVLNGFNKMLQLF